MGIRIGKRGAIAISAFALATGAGGYFANQKLFPPKHLTAKSQPSSVGAEMQSPPLLPEGVHSISFPKVYKTEEEIKSMLAAREKHGAVFQGLKELPKDEKMLTAMLLEADERKLLIWGDNSSDLKKISDFIRNYVELYSGDLSLVIGYNHSIEAQIRFMNELISSGNDGVKIAGITHLALEMYGSDAGKEENVHEALTRWSLSPSDAGESMYRGDLQSYVDHYLATGDPTALSFIRSYVDYAQGYREYECIDDQIAPLQIAAEPDNNYRIIASNLSINEKADLGRRVNGKRLLYAAREAFAVDYVQKFLYPDRDNRVAYFWGLEHIEKEGLPKHIRYEQKGFRVVVVALNGGKNDSNLYFDRALKYLAKKDQKWEKIPFVWMLRGVREADMVVHLPSDGAIKYIDKREKAALIILR